MSALVPRVVALVVNRVRVNRVQQRVLEGVPVFVKRRKAGGQISVRLVNLLLALAHSGLCMFVSADEWIAWEIHCGRLLYPEGPAAKAGPGPVLIMPKISGTSLRTLLHHGEMDVEKAVILAAHELRRAHHLQCNYYKAAWSHGDLHLDNIICDLSAERAVLIDFDIHHDFRMGQTHRHGDDVKVVVLELLGQSNDRWSQLATAFINQYGEGDVLSELRRQLVVPRGFARLLWYSRTNGSSIRRIEPRLQRLREIIQARN